ncbi:unnamed protein product [Clonostachys rhizophaga]|uniref:Uncharacterized protein n=1 Tax=Clonostachys rhizophaga TaxID=160324 RepID=A0A9N9YLM3_9HYPO|nr:unnamed protein product [Clonostachys rhizophaga]
MVARVQRRWREEARAEDSPQLIQTRVINFATTMTPILTHLSQNPFERIFSGGSKRMTLARVERALRHNLNELPFHAIPEDF